MSTAVEDTLLRRWPVLAAASALFIEAGRA